MNRHTNQDGKKQPLGKFVDGEQPVLVLHTNATTKQQQKPAKETGREDPGLHKKLDIVDRTVAVFGG